MPSLFTPFVVNAPNPVARHAHPVDRRQHVMYLDGTADIRPGTVVHWKTVSTIPQPRSLFTPRTVTRHASPTPILGPENTPLFEGWLGMFRNPDGTEQSENTHGLAAATTFDGFDNLYRRIVWAAPLLPSPILWDWFCNREEP